MARRPKNEQRVAVALPAQGDTPCNWLGAPAEREPLGIRASIRHSVWTYTIAEVAHVEFTFDDNSIPQWSKRIDPQTSDTVRASHPVRIDSVIVRQPDVGSHSWLTFWHETYEEGMTSLAREYFAPRGAA